MKLKLWVLLFALFSVSAYAQNATLKGKVVDAETGKPIQGVAVLLKERQKSTMTGSNGNFHFDHLNPGLDVIEVNSPEIFPMNKNITIRNGKNDLGELKVRIQINAGADEGAVFVFSENQIDDDEHQSNTTANLMGASDDIYIRTSSFSYSPMRFNLRGYNPEYSATYINGVSFNDGERGRFNYSMLGGMNSLFKQKDVINYSDASSFGFGAVGGSTNIMTNASQYAPGGSVSLAATNRAYVLRGMGTFSTGLMQNGWAFTGGLIYRWSKEGAWDGTFYNSWGYFFGAEKVFNDRHSIALTTFGAPTQRGQQSATTQEMYDLAGSIYYNPNWGYENGKKRNSRVVDSYDPTVVVNHTWKIDNVTNLKTGIGFHYNNYSNTAIGFYNAADPRPDYYRYSTESMIAGINEELIRDLWKNNPNYSQINWDRMYQDNYKNNNDYPNDNAKYMVEQRHNNLMEGSLNSTFNTRLSSKLKLTMGVNAQLSKGMHYKTMNDLLGGNLWIDKDQFAERDAVQNPNLDPNIIQNDLRNPNRIIKEGDKFGYNYDMNVTRLGAFAQNEWNFRKVDFYYAARFNYTSFYRDGHMQNGRAPQNSYGKSKSYYFMDPSVKAGVTYKINGRNWITANALAETRAPLANNSYVSPRIKATIVPNLQQEKVLSYDLSYNFSFPFVKGRVSGFRTHVLGSNEINGYYDDGYRTFINHMMTDLDKLYQGVELGAAFQLGRNFSLTLAGTYADYKYTSNALGIMSAENGTNLRNDPNRPDLKDLVETVMTKDLHQPTGPQTVGSIKLDYFHPKMWFADVTVSYFGRNYLDFAPSAYTKSMYDIYTPEQKAIFGTQTELKDGIMVDASIGKLIYLPKRRSLSINLSLSNLTNNTKMITGGYQQGRIDLANPTKFANKYYYAQGFNFFLNMGYKF
ncbi:MAG: carboxypeptidase-like regulatory domain-containing protein [Bacteroidales bacterium]